MGPLPERIQVAVGTNMWSGARPGIKEKVMQKNRIVISAAIILQFIAVVGLRAAAPGSAPTVLDVSADGSDAAFASDLESAQDLLRKLAKERSLNDAESAKYVSKGVSKAKAFYAEAHKTLMPHAREMMRKMNDPEGMIAEGQRMAAKDPSSWQAYDYIASGQLRKMNIDESMANYEKAITFAPEQQRDWYRNMLATCYRVKKNPEKAFQLYEEIIEANDNWMAVKSAYLGASMMLIGSNDSKAADYFDKGMTASTQGEREALLKSGICGKFNGSPKLPATCSKGNAL